MNVIKELFPCPCCLRKTITELGGYEICEICGWEDDPTQSGDPEYKGGANLLSLNQAKAEWLKSSR
jgi:Cysteine-rich CPCC